MKKIWAETFAHEASVDKIPFKGLLLFSIMTNVLVITAVLILIYFKRIPPQVPVFYGSPEGQDQLAANWLLILPALSSTVFLGANSLVSYLLDDDFLKKILIISGITTMILSTITTAKVLYLIGFF